MGFVQRLRSFTASDNWNICLLLYSLSRSPTIASPSFVSDPAFSPSTTHFLIDSPTGHRVSYTDFIRQFQSLSAALLMKFPTLSKNQVALILSLTSIHIPVIYFFLLSTFCGGGFNSGEDGAEEWRKNQASITICSFLIQIDGEGNSS
ncbi:hypothetical protein L2E82_00044 [Cichorium intybus]|uniref:Uncharacterized protein n=1 Tax=Cichorium intybus TaxID=13427 RepID=A0ACB9GXK6_CICIN|nr:hypothetical protein L2E82_00044 [Cichorium intybus]